MTYRAHRHQEVLLGLREASLVDIMCLCSLCEFVVAQLFITFMFMSFENVHKCSRAHKHYTFSKRGRYVFSGYDLDMGYVDVF